MLALDRTRKLTAWLCVFWMVGCGTGDILEGDADLQERAAATTEYQAESATGKSGCTVATNFGGYTGSGFMDYGGNGTWIEWNNVKAATAGDYKLTFRYAVASSSRPTTVLINGVNVGDVAFSASGAWATWKTVSLTKALKAGNNTIRVLANTSRGGPNLDKMDLVFEGGAADGQCAVANENGTANLSCPSGQVIESIPFASYGTPTGACPSFATSSCHASTSKSRVESACLNKQSCSVSASNAVFGDPCAGTSKKLAVAFTCSGGSAQAVITASGENLPDEGREKAFDGRTDTKWLTFADFGWIQYQFANGASKTVTSYSIASANDKPERDPRDWRLMGSNDSSSWTTLDTRTGQSFSARFQKKSYSISNARAFRIYRLDISSNFNPVTASSTQLSEIEFHEGAVNDTCPNDPNKTEPGKCGCGVPEGTCEGPSVPDVLSTKIVYPFRSTTAIVKAGDSFDVWFVADNASQVIKGVQLRGPYNLVNATHKVATGNWVYDPISGKRYNTKITVTVPASAPAERYDLVVKTSSVNEVSAGAVKVVKEYKNSYYIVHMSDAHRWQSGYEVTTTLHKVSAIIDVANIIDAEMIFETGDGLYCHTGNASVTADRVATMFGGMAQEGIKGLHGAYAATFVVPGNHDSPSNNYSNDASSAETAAFFNKYYGLQSYGFKYGNGRFMGVNSGMGPVPSSQASEAVSWLNAVGHGNFKLGAGHAGGGAFTSFDAKTGLDLILVGHNHFIASDNPHEVNGEPIQYVANSLRDKGTGNFEFNLFKVNNQTGAYEAVGGTGSRVRVIQNHTAENIAAPASWIPNLALSYAKANNGSARANKATIVNRYSFPISGARVRFVVPLGYTYAVSRGVVKQAFNGDKAHVVDVAVDLAANSTTVVDIL